MPQELQGQIDIAHGPLRLICGIFPVNPLSCPLGLPRRSWSGAKLIGSPVQVGPAYHTGSYAAGIMS